MRSSRAALALLCLAGCASPKTTVWVDTDQVFREAPAPVRTSVPSPKPPGPLPPATFTIPGRPAEVLTGRSSATPNRTVSATAGQEEQALKALQRRLEAIYARQANFYEAEQRRLLGDPEKQAFEQIRPQLLAAFQKYGHERMPVFLKLISLVGFPDPNPHNNPPPAGLRPVPLANWQQANALRDQLEKMDTAYSQEATALLAQSARLADQKRLELLKKVDAFRRQMMERAVTEAANPLRKSLTSVDLTIGGDAPIQVPATAPVTVTIPGLPAMNPLPKVEFEEDLLSDSARKREIKHDLEIWLGINNLTLAPQPRKGVPDRTSEFSNWRRQQRLGL